MSPLVRDCQGLTLSSQITVFLSVTVSWPVASVMRQRHQICAPGGSEPDWRMSQVHFGLTLVPGVIGGKAWATTSPQVCSTSPYSSTTEVMLAVDVACISKVTVLGKSSTA